MCYLVYKSLARSTYVGPLTHNTCKYVQGYKGKEVLATGFVYYV